MWTSSGRACACVRACVCVRVFIQDSYGCLEVLEFSAAKMMLLKGMAGERMRERGRRGGVRERERERVGGRKKEIERE